LNTHDLIEFINPLNTSRFKPEGEVGPLVQDSRQVTEGSVFIAIRGTEVDGHMFLEDAIHRGAKVIICEESYYTDADVCVIEVENTRSLIGPLAQKMAGNPGDQLKIIGITGTNGKTTTATLVYQALTELGQKISLLGTVEKKILGNSLDSKLTTADPIELAYDMRKMVEAGSEYLVMEVSSHALHQARVAGFKFSIAAFTNLSQDHLDYHETIEEYAAAKKILFAGLNSESSAIINMDDSYGSFMKNGISAKITELAFGKNAEIISNSAEGLKISVNGIEISSSLVGHFNAINIAQAFLICDELGFDGSAIASALSAVPGAPGRMESVSLGSEAHLPKVIVDYAHTPDALENVLKTLSDLRAPNQLVYCVFGAGGDRDSGKRPEMAKAVSNFADEIIVTSDNPRTENPDLIIADILHGFENTDNVVSITSRRNAIFKAVELASSNDIILIAGKGHENYQEIDGKRYPFDDRLVAKEALELKAKGGF
jgi:UDP-N-acetylmuramoyl-L-alanyl-D-glutamate--2,6-diaminopimelate ligase|tara:strand:- start:14019 stop:15479 length:1461 start_codon:yes stop_codon:yes gene_type:complete